ncbi:MAG: DUF5060 domain-containing protein [Clostridia bacterium]
MTTKKFEILDIKFTAKTTRNPFCEVDFYAIVKSSADDKGIKIHGFYNGGDEYILRFNFNEIGEYSYTTHSDIRDLDGHTGTVTVIENDDTSKHGPLVLNDKNKNRIYHYDGTHYNLCGFECDWLFAISYDDKEKLTKTKRLAKELAENKLNHVIMNVYAYDIQWEKDPRIMPEHEQGERNDIFPFGGSNVEPDFTTLNVDFFKHLDNVISILDKENIVSHLMIYVWNKKVNWPECSSKWDNMYFDYVVKRYGAFSNIMWDVSKEALSYGYCDMDYIVERTVRLKKLDAFKRLVTVHDYQFCETFPTLVDVISTQTWLYDIHAVMLGLASKHPDKPVFNLEHGGYEEGDYSVFTGTYTNAEHCLRRNYAILFAGTYSCYYWQPISWSATMMPWEAKIKPHFEYYKYMNEFFIENEYETLAPAEKLGQGGYYLANKDLSKILIYCHGDVFHATLPASGALDGKECTYKCFNIYTGEYSEEKNMKLTRWNSFVPAFDNDCIVVVDVK